MTCFRVNSPGGGGFSMPIRSTPRAHPASCTMGMGLFWENGWAVVLNIHSLLAPRAVPPPPSVPT